MDLDTFFAQVCTSFGLPAKARPLQVGGSPGSFRSPWLIAYAAGTG